jgi:hypothetical protein
MTNDEKVVTPLEGPLLTQPAVGPIVKKGALRNVPMDSIVSKKT